jgi:N-acetylglucosaminyl-diphospho-decaprenol L-rhamnosyltransferase
VRAPSPLVSTPSDHATIAVVIVNYNSGSYLARCVGSLPDGCAPSVWDAVVVDNLSTDGSEGVAAGHSAGVRLVRAGRNLGFAAAANLGVRSTRAPYVLLLNPDARLTPGCLQGLVDELTTRPDCAIVAPLVVNEDGTPQGNARGDPTMITGLLGRTSLVRRLFPRWPGAARQVMPSEAAGAEPSVEVDWVSGACCLVRRRAFEDVRGFDEGYFLYWEDADLCRRIRQQGGRIRFRPDPAAPVVHAVGRSSEGAGADAIHAFHDSAYRYYATHVAPGRFSPARWIAWLLLKARARILNATR